MKKDAGYALGLENVLGNWCPDMVFGIPLYLNILFYHRKL